MARSGRATSSAASRSSRQPRSWSARERYPSASVRVPIGPTLGHRPHARRCAVPGRSPVSGVELRHGAATDVGLVREVNEDALLAPPPLFVVADGMGGHDRGDVASAARGRGVRRASPSAATTPSTAPTRWPRRCGAARTASRRTTREQRARRAPATSRPARPRSSRCSSQRRRRADVAAGQPRRLACLPARRRRRLEQVSVDHSRGPGAGRRRPRSPSPTPPCTRSAT